MLMLKLLVVFQQTLDFEKFAAKITEKRTNRPSLTLIFFHSIHLICFSTIILIAKKKEKKKSNSRSIKRSLDHKKNSLFCR